MTQDLVSFTDNDLAKLPTELQELAKRCEGRAITQGEVIKGYGQVGNTLAFLVHLKRRLREFTPGGSNERFVTRVLNAMDSP